MLQLEHDTQPKSHRYEGSAVINKPKVTLPELSLRKIEGETMEMLMAKYKLTEDEIKQAGWQWDTNSNRLYMPMLGIWSTIGFVLRSFDKNVRPKAISYRTASWSPGYCLYKKRGVISQSKLLIVEDQPSALRASSKIDSLALLGCNLGEELVGRLKNMHYKEIILCLDADAFSRCLELQKKYMPLFDAVPVVKPPKDLKNMERTELEEFLNGILRT